MSRRGLGQAKKLDCVYFGKRLKELRVEKRISVKSMAELVGVQENYIRQLEIGNKTPSFDTLIAIINALGVTSDELLCDYVNNAVPEIIESRIGKLIAQIPREQRDRIEAHIMLDIDYEK